MTRTGNSSIARNETGLAGGGSGAFSSSSPSTSSVLGESKKQNVALSKAPIFVSPTSSASFSPTCKNPLFLAEKCPKFPAGRYRSPTDSLISPISRGLLLAKGRKGVQSMGTSIPPKVLDATYDHVTENL